MIGKPHSEEGCGAVVADRVQRGAREKSEFKSIDDLQKVAAIDPAGIEVKKGLLVF